MTDIAVFADRQFSVLLRSREGKNFKGPASFAEVVPVVFNFRSQLKSRGHNDSDGD